MKFIFDKESMIKEISIAQEIISTKNAGSILSNVMISASNNTLTIKATDIKVNYETQIPVQITEEGITTVYCDKFMGILNSLPEGEIEFDQSSDESGVDVRIKPVGKKIKFQMKSMSQDKFPEFDSADNVPYFEIPSKDLKEMIEQKLQADTYINEIEKIIFSYLNLQDMKAAHNWLYFQVMSALSSDASCMSIPDSINQMMQKQLSEKGADGVKHVVEKSWFSRGTLLMVQGIRREADFIPKKRKDSFFPVISKITKINEDGSLEFQTERMEIAA